MADIGLRPDQGAALAPLELAGRARPVAPSARRLAELVGPTVYQQRIADLAGTFLAQFELVTVQLDLTVEERASYEREMGLFRALQQSAQGALGRPGWDELVRWASRTPEGR